MACNNPDCNKICDVRFESLHNTLQVHQADILRLRDSNHTTTGKVQQHEGSIKHLISVIDEIKSLVKKHDQERQNDIARLESIENTIKSIPIYFKAGLFFLIISQSKDIISATKLLGGVFGLPF